jgi:xylulokinase
VLRSGDSEVGARGAFLVGLVATGAAANVRDAADDHVRLRATVHPRPGRYGEAYQDFLALRETGSRTWPLLAEMRSRP